MSGDADMDGLIRDVRSLSLKSPPIDISSSSVDDPDGTKSPSRPTTQKQKPYESKTAPFTALKPRRQQPNRTRPPRPSPDSTEPILVDSSDEGEPPSAAPVPSFSSQSLPTSYLLSLTSDVATLHQKHILRTVLNDRSRKDLLLRLDNIPVTKSQLGRLIKPSAWLDDETVNGYLALLGATTHGDVLCMSTFFYASLTKGGYDYEAVARWTRRWPAGVFAHSKVVVPINQGNYHWVLVTIDMTTRTLVYHDSMSSSSTGSFGRTALSTMKRYLSDERTHKHPASSIDASLRDFDVWRCEHRNGSAPQRDGGSCGVFLCLFAKAFVMGRTDARPSQRDADAFRMKIACDLVGMLEGSGVDKVETECG
ncbi:hypothetical protein HKX48_006161 [Thoreauomyces humboldtii]|nr:hypothetical protein HKX48_006161 [Thoreauomyces humboldtii]